MDAMRRWPVGVRMHAATVVAFRIRGRSQLLQPRSAGLWLRR